MIIKNYRQMAAKTLTATLFTGLANIGDKFISVNQ
jgi:hypothetical protein